MARPPRRRQQEPGEPPRARVRQSGAILVSVAMLAISFWLLTNLVGQVLTSAQIDRQRAEVEAEIAKIESDNAALKDQVTYAESPAYAEQAAREQLGMAREGDTVILPTFPDTTPTAAAPTPAPVPTPTAEPNWRAWQQAVFSSSDSH